MLSFPQYTEKMESIGFVITFDHYLRYLYYEASWLNYLHYIFMPNQNCIADEFLRLIVMESCPQGNFPHQNYIFEELHNNLRSPEDRYLQQIYSGFFPDIIWQNISKEDALIQLSQQNVFLFDLVPSHGFALDQDLRNGINLAPDVCCHFDKVKYVTSQFNNPNFEIRSVFSMPPTYNIELLNRSINAPDNPKYRGTMTAGAGYPSYNLLRALIFQGF